MSNIELKTTTVTHTGRTYAVSLVTPKEPDQSPYLLTRIDGRRPQKGMKFVLWRDRHHPWLLLMSDAANPVSGGGMPDRYFKEESPGVLKEYII